jgi:hypothetical protein
MDEKVIDIILSRIDRLEDEFKAKMDILISSHWKRVGISIAASFIFSIIFGVVLALIERH